MPPDQYIKMAKVIFDGSDILFPEYEKPVFESRHSARLIELKLEHDDQYIASLTMGPAPMDEFQEMLNRITTDDTSSIRNEASLEVFEMMIFPKLLNVRAPSKRLQC